MTYHFIKEMDEIIMYNSLKRNIYNTLMTFFQLFDSIIRKPVKYLFLLRINIL